MECMQYSTFDENAGVWVNWTSSQENPELRLPVGRLARKQPISIQDVQFVVPGDAHPTGTSAVARGLPLQGERPPCVPCEPKGMPLYVVFFVFRALSWVTDLALGK